MLDESVDFRLFGVKLRELQTRNWWKILADARLGSKQKEDGILAGVITKSKLDYDKNLGMNFNECEIEKQVICT